MSSKEVLTLTGGRSVRAWWRKERTMPNLLRLDGAPVRAYLARRGELVRLRRWDRKDYRRLGDR